MYVDSHCHINLPDLYGKIPDLLSTMAKNRVTHALCVSVDLPTFPQVLELAKTYSNIYASVGVHPEYDKSSQFDVRDLIDLSSHSKVIAIGETGLDYSHLQGDMGWQHERFRRHIKASRATGKPLIIHTRSASADTIRILQEEGASINDGGAGGVMHCFTESLEVAEAAIAMGFYISFSGILTFKNAKHLQSLALEVPLTSILIETDAPYLAPAPNRGKINEPGWVVHVGRFLAKLKGMQEEQVAIQTTSNFFDLFKCRESDVR